MKIDSPLFIGLSHLGQIYAVGWSYKFGNCYVYDFEKKKLNNFKLKKFTKEEPDIKEYFKKKKYNIFNIKDVNEIKNFKNIVISIDTPINLYGIPDRNKIISYIKKLKNFISDESNLIISTQVYPGFCNYIKTNLLKNRNINVYYLVDTLIMGNAFERFLNPERIIIGSDELKKPKIFNKIRAKYYIYTLKEAELVKSAVNIYLLFSVTFANCMDQFARDNDFSYAKIISSLRQDPRIGMKSYINSSLGISGGHLERDLFFLTRNTKDKFTKKIFKVIKNHHNKRINLLIRNSLDLIRKHNLKKIVWIGQSYKKDSFSLVNSPFFNFINKVGKKIKISLIDDVFIPKKYKNVKIIQLNKKNNFNKTLIIFNYSSNRLFSNFTFTNNSCYIINISNKKINIENNKNIIDLFL
jgi:nucleotide sugar dehydrogenase